MEYRDFILRFGRQTHGGFELTVVESPVGMGRGIFLPPSSFEEIEVKLPSLWRNLDIHRVPEPRSLKQVGSELYRALFSGEAGDLFNASFGVMNKQGDSGLRIKMMIDPQHEKAGFLQALPWESLCNPETGSFLALSRLTPVIRYWQSARVLQEPPRGSIFRILLVAPRPSGFIPLDLDAECQSIASALQGIRGVEVRILERPTLHSLHSALLDKETHAIHFAGMAGFDHNLQQGGFFFESEEGGDAFVAGELLAAALRDSGTLRLIVLNACDTAKVVGDAKLNPFRSISTTLVHTGFPAVVGMQFPISDRAAITFSASFYARLAAGDSLEEALTEGRQSVYMMDAQSPEWATPVLFTRLPAGRLFSDSEQSTPSVRLKIFLCHSSRDKPTVRELYHRLTAEGFDVWLDEVNILPGKFWRQEIIKALRESHVILICLSQGAVSKAGFVQKEIRIALDLLDEQPNGSLFVIPVRLEACDIPERLEEIQ